MNVGWMQTPRSRGAFICNVMTAPALPLPGALGAGIGFRRAALEKV